jgi:aminoglycoside phosphotransferase (APT) family kinase protein
MLAPLASGRTADVFAIDAQRVLRRYRDGQDVTAEAEIMSYVRELGFAVPKVYAAQGEDMVMERLNGPTMLQALGGGELDLLAAAEVLADLHRRLHRLPPRLCADPGVRILHLDLHPDNVMLTQRGPVVIDWRNATEGPADLDVALTALILAQVACDETSDLAAAAHTLMREFLLRAHGNPLRMMDRAVAMRSTDPALARAEVHRLTRAAALISESM